MSTIAFGHDIIIPDAGHIGPATTPLSIQIEADGTCALKKDTYWAGASSGLPYGSCYGNHIGWSQANAVQNTWYNISDADMADGSLNLFTHDGNGKLTATKAGTYLINYQICFEDDVVNDHIETGIEIDGSGSADNAGIGHSENKFASEEEHLSSTAILTLTAGQTIEIAIRTTDAGTPTITVQGLNITVVMVGG